MLQHVVPAHRKPKYLDEHGVQGAHQHHARLMLVGEGIPDDVGGRAERERGDHREQRRALA